MTKEHLNSPTNMHRKHYEWRLTGSINRCIDSNNLRFGSVKIQEHSISNQDVLKQRIHQEDKKFSATKS